MATLPPVFATLIGAVGTHEFAAYHAAHSRLTTRVVLPPMTIELLSSLVLLFERPGGVGTAAWTAHSGVVLWMLTAAARA